MKTNTSLWFCFAGRTMRGTKVYALQRTCVGVQPNFIFYESVQKELQRFPTTHTTQEPLLLSLHILFPFLHLLYYASKFFINTHKFLLFDFISTISFSIYIALFHNILCILFIDLTTQVVDVTTYYCGVLGFVVEIWSMFAHYLVENKIGPDPRHVLCNAKPSMSIIVFSPTCGQTKQN
jgi:hypothetical protein